MPVNIKVTSINIESPGGPALGAGRIKGRAIVHVTISTIGPILQGQVIELSFRNEFDDLNGLLAAAQTDLQTFAKELAESAEYLQV
jgi:hypothetical protein